jgi:hypothetical protein
MKIAEDRSGKVTITNLHSSITNENETGKFLLMPCMYSSNEGHTRTNMLFLSILKGSDDGVLRLKESCFWTLSIV